MNRDKVIDTDLQRGYFLSFTLDEALLNYPWELVYDDDFYCLKHRVGRIVNSSEKNPPSMESAEWWGERLERPSVLVIAPCRPEVPGYPELPAARDEAVAITELLQNDLGLRVDALIDEKATFSNVIEALQIRIELDNDIKYQIIHFCGHADYDETNSGNGCLILHDQKLETNLIAAHFGDTRPILCFINACNSAQTAAASTSPASINLMEQFNIYDLGRAFLRTGAYLVGSRWMLSDGVAKRFALSFYESLLLKGDPIGEAIRLSRVTCKDEFADDFGWASYVFYGDPRVRFLREERDESEDETVASAVAPEE